MEQSLALEIMLAGHSVLLSGPAGSGKTHVLNEFIGRARRDGKHVSVTATTGLAATHLNGTTIHAWSGIGIHDSLPPRYADSLTKSRRDIIAKTDVLIIDEISMLHDYRLDMINEIAKAVRLSDKPFGGLQVIMSGDFFQLPPVSRGQTLPGNFVVGSEAWRELEPAICYLNEQHRQDDQDYLEILQALRLSDIRRRHVDNLLTRKNAGLGDEERVTELHTTNLDVDRINQARLSRIREREHFYSMATTGKSNYVEALKRACLATEELGLKPGALVMCIRNSQDKRYVNGSLGVVIDFDKATDYPIIELRSGRKLTITPETWELRDGDKKRASLTQLPLRLAWAITVHKSQGMTLDAARIDLARAFVEGMGYVALSRVRRLENLCLLGLNRMALRVSPLALEIDELLRAKSASDYQKFVHLKALAANRKTEVRPKRTTGKRTIDELRRDFPNAYKPWPIDEEEKLLAMFKKGAGLKELCAAFKRQPGGIRSRLRKHLGDDIAIPR